MTVKQMKETIATYGNKVGELNTKEQMKLLLSLERAVEKIEMLNEFIQMSANTFKSMCE